LRDYKIKLAEKIRTSTFPAKTKFWKFPIACPRPQITIYCLFLISNFFCAVSPAISDYGIK
jgi:hypothetical protein